MEPQRLAELRAESKKAVLLIIPDYDSDSLPYPGDIKPGSYNHQEVVDLLREHYNNPEAIYFIADMME